MAGDDAQAALDAAVADYLHALSDGDDSVVPTAWILVAAADPLNEPGACHMFQTVMGGALPHHTQLGLLEYAAARCRQRITENGREPG